MHAFGRHAMAPPGSQKRRFALMEQYDPLVAPAAEEWLELDESERIWLVQDYHRRMRIELPDAQVHAMIHAVVENQIAAGDALPVQRTMQRLLSEGLDRHDALHAIGA